MDAASPMKSNNYGWFPPPFTVNDYHEYSERVVSIVVHAALATAYVLALLQLMLD